MGLDIKTLAVTKKVISDTKTDLTESSIISALGYTPINSNKIGSNDGIASLDTNGKVPTYQLPFVIDANLSETSENPISNKAVKKALDDEITRATTQEALKSPIADPIFTGIPKAPTPSEDTNNTQIATTAFTNTAVSNHNTSATAHDDIRIHINDISTRLNAVLDSDDLDLDQLSEIVAYIKSNRSLIDSITTSKVSVSDIIDSLTSTATNKPLSAKQGKMLNDLITALTSEMGDKVDKVTGKGLSTNDFTNTEKDKLDGIASGAEVNVQSDWNVTDSNSDAFIKNKPTSLPADGGTAQTISEILPISKGGTGSSNASTALNNLTSAAGNDSDSRDLNDYDMAITKHSSGSIYTYKTKLSKFWTYIKSKLMNVGISNLTIGDEDDESFTINGWGLVGNGQQSIENFNTIDAHILKIENEDINDIFLQKPDGDELLINGDLRLRYNDEYYGNKISFGDSDHVWLYEDDDDHLEIRGDNGIKLLTDGGDVEVIDASDSRQGNLYAKYYTDNAIISSKTTVTHLAGNKGEAIINSTAPANQYTMLDKLNSTNGYFTDGVYQNKRVFYYTSKTKVNGNQNSVDKEVTLLDESGNTSFPGIVTATTFSGNATTATNADTVDGKHASDFVLKSGDIITGDLRLKGSSNFGNKLNFGDGDYVYLHEYEDDKLEIKASTLKITSNNNIICNKPIACDITGSASGLSSVLPISKGGTGATTAEQARANLGITGTGGASINTVLKNGDFDTIKTPGFYTIINASHAPSVDETYSWGLIVVSTAAHPISLELEKYELYQIAFLNNSYTTPNVFVRCFSDGNIGDWYKFNLTKV